MTTICIRQKAAAEGEHAIDLTLKRPGQADLEGHAKIQFALTPQEQEELRWYVEDYLQRAESVEDVQIEQIETWMKQRGEELYNKVLDANQTTCAIWFAVREHLADLRIEITTGIAEAASIPWELMRDPQSDSAIALRVQAFVRVPSDPNTAFISVPPPPQMDASDCSTPSAAPEVAMTSNSAPWPTASREKILGVKPAARNSLN